MDKRAAKKLKIGDTVIFRPDSALGKVTDRNWMGVRIEWEDGTAGIWYHGAMQDVERNVRIGAED